MNVDPDIFPTVPDHLRRGHVRDEDRAIAKHAELLETMAKAVGRQDHGQHDILDIGCGVKFTQCFLTYDLPLGSYTGVDIYGEMLDYLRSVVQDPRFEYHAFDVHNEMYNPSADPMTVESDFGVGDKRFDLICGFSLFTHLAPPDFEVMLRLMRRVVRPTGHLYFTAFLYEATPGGHGMIDNFLRHVDAEVLVDALTTGVAEPADFTDFIPAKPLLQAVYSRRHAIELIERAGWEICEIADPVPEVQHQFLCRPA